MDKPKAILKFKKQIKKIDELKSLHSESIEFERWRKITKLLIQETFGSNSDHYKDFSSISYNPMKMAFTGDSELQGTTEQEKKEVYIDGLSQAESLLKKILIDINEYPDVESDIKKKKAVKSKRTKTYRSAFSKYSYLSYIGEGGSGKVYKVQNEDNEFFALKCLDPQKINKQKARRFENELKFCYRSIDKNIVKVLDYGLHNENDKEYPFYIMSYYPQTLRKLMDNKIEPEQIMKLFSQILDGVEVAHLKGVYHRDLKPENILYDSSSDNLVIADFGIAHFSEEELHTLVNIKKSERLANFQYAAPEQRVKGEKVDGRADVYALGLILNEMYTGMLLQGTAYKKIGNVAPDYEYLDNLVEKMIRQSANERIYPIDEIKKDLIARKNKFISRQKLNELNKTVISYPETDDPLVNNPVRLISFDYRNDILFLKLNQNVTTKWEEVFKNITGCIAIGGMTPREFIFSSSKVTIPVKENLVQILIDYFKTYIEKANIEYKHRINNELKQQEIKEIELQKKKILEEEKRQRILKNTKI